MIDVLIVQGHVNKVTERYTAAETVNGCPDGRLSVYEHNWI